MNEFQSGKKNLISDVKGVTVGHKTISDGNIQTGVTIIKPSSQNIFKHKLIAASYVINGFGKTVGLIQIDELGTLESIIALTNTLSVGTVTQAVVEYMLKDNPEIGTTTGTINPVVGECNDMYLNDIRQMVIQKEDVFEAIANCQEEFSLGSVGAGRGMTCFGLKGGIGSASRICSIYEQTYTVGALVLTNFGLQKDFMKNNLKWDDEIEKGSIIIILATDIPLSSRQLKRVCKRATVSLSRLGSHLGNGSGDIVIAFSTANVINHEEQGMIDMKMIHEDQIDTVFRASIEAIEEAILSSLIYNETVKGKDGHQRVSLKDYLNK